MTVSDAAALGVAAIFASRTPSGLVLERFHRTGTADSDDRIAAARIEQSFASPEGHAALHCLIGWGQARAPAAR